MLHSQGFSQGQVDGHRVEQGFILDPGENSLCGDRAHRGLGNTTISTQLWLENFA